MPHEECEESVAMIAREQLLRRRCFFHERPGLFSKTVKRTLFTWCEVCRKRMERTASEVDSPEYMTNEIHLAEEASLP